MELHRSQSGLEMSSQELTKKSWQLLTERLPFGKSQKSAERRGALQLSHCLAQIGGEGLLAEELQPTYTWWSAVMDKLLQGGPFPGAVPL